MSNNNNNKRNFQGKIILEIDPIKYSIGVDIDCTVNSELKLCILNSLAMALSDRNTAEASLLLMGAQELISEFAKPDKIKSYTQLEDGTLIDNDLLDALNGIGEE